LFARTLLLQPLLDLVDLKLAHSLRLVFPEEYSTGFAKPGNNKCITGGPVFIKRKCPAVVIILNLRIDIVFYENRDAV
jgi:hypothetical protein